jgi:hypothetical protein
MARQKSPTNTSATKARARAQQLARDAAARYVAALGQEIPYDVAPGDVNLIDAVVEIQDVLAPASSHLEGSKEHAALNAGYLLGVEIGRRIGGGR